MKETLRQMLAAHGVRPPEERLDSIAAAIAAQLQAEREATRALAFESEPASFFRTLEAGSK